MKRTGAALLWLLSGTPCPAQSLPHYRTLDGGDYWGYSPPTLSRPYRDDTDQPTLEGLRSKPAELTGVEQPPKTLEELGINAEDPVRNGNLRAEVVEKHAALRLASKVQRETCARTRLRLDAAISAKSSAAEIRELRSALADSRKATRRASEDCASFEVAIRRVHDGALPPWWPGDLSCAPCE